MNDLDMQPERPDRPPKHSEFRVNLDHPKVSPVLSAQGLRPQGDWYTPSPHLRKRVRKALSRSVSDTRRQNRDAISPGSGGLRGWDAGSSMRTNSGEGCVAFSDAIH